jgi:hypothetical protein
MSGVNDDEYIWPTSRLTANTALTVSRRGLPRVVGLTV